MQNIIQNIFQNLQPGTKFKFNRSGKDTVIQMLFLCWIRDIALMRKNCSSGFLVGDSCLDQETSDFIFVLPKMELIHSGDIQFLIKFLKMDTESRCFRAVPGSFAGGFLFGKKCHLMPSFVNIRSLCGRGNHGGYWVRLVLLTKSESMCIFPEVGCWSLEQAQAIACNYGRSCFL